MSKALAYFVLLFGTPLAWSIEYSHTLTPEHPYAKCFQGASEMYGIDVFLLSAIASKESNYQLHAVGPKNDNGTHDIGIMQINSSWLARLSQRGISRSVLLTDACLNIQVGAWILAMNFYEKGVSWESVGAYNAGMKPSYTQALRRYEYSADIYKRYQDIKRKYLMDVVIVSAVRLPPQEANNRKELADIGVYGNGG